MSVPEKWEAVAVGGYMLVVLLAWLVTLPLWAAYYWGMFLWEGVNEHRTSDCVAGTAGGPRIRC